MVGVCEKLVRPSLIVPVSKHDPHTRHASRPAVRHGETTSAEKDPFSIGKR